MSFDLGKLFIEWRRIVPNGVPNPTEINISRFFTTVRFFTEAGINFPAQAIRKVMKLDYKVMKSRKNISFRTFLTSDIISNKNSKDIMEYYIPYFEKQLKY